MTPQQKQAEERRKRALELKAQGLSVKVIAQRMGFSPAAVRSWVYGKREKAGEVEA